MKKQNKLTANFYMVSTCIIVAFVSIVMTSCTAQKTDQQVMEAYNLRINGQADSAMVLLEQIISNDEENDLAWFELSRTTFHLGQANPREINETLKTALKQIEEAISISPKNADFHSYKGKIETLQFYVAMQMGNKNAAEYLTILEGTYKTVLELDPTFYGDKLTLVEFFGGLPEDMGGDKVKAEIYAKELESSDLIAGAKAREIMMPEDADYEKFWKDIITEDPDNACAHQALGRIYLFLGNIDEAESCYTMAIELNPAKNKLYLDLGRYQLMQAMQNPGVLDSVQPLVEIQFNKFLNSSPEPTNPMKAWVYSKYAMINFRTGNKDQGNKYQTMADELDPFHSPAFGAPDPSLYSPPNNPERYQGYYLSPF